MNFLEANRIVSGFRGGEPLPFLLALSGNAGPLEIYLKAQAAMRGRAASVRTLPFNTLAQAVLQPPVAAETEVFLLLPWDFVPEADWRSGVPAAAAEFRELENRAATFADRLKQRPNARFLYLPAPIPPVLSHPREDAKLGELVFDFAAAMGAEVVSREAFSLSGYLGSGCPVTGAWLGKVAEPIVALALAPAEACKVLVTDLDNVLWAGVVAEEGLERIAFSAEGLGYRHFLYQSLLLKLKRQGVLLAAVSRNDPEDALAPLKSGRMQLREQDFVCVFAGYNAKSAQIRELAERLNLSLGSFVFVDDNPVELAEVSAKLPQVRCLAFPAEDGLPEFFRSLARLFAKSSVTDEDQERTELYRRRLEGMPPSQTAGADLTEFLRGLGMTLALQRLSAGSCARLVQLINKTNQFNLNGRRTTEQEVAALLGARGRAYAATLQDRTGSHGEILACLVSAEGDIISLAMSCRVFQRRVEHAFLAWLAQQPNPPRRLLFAATPRNQPLSEFLKEPAFTGDGKGVVQFDAPRFAAAHAGDLALFSIRGPMAEGEKSA